MKLTTAGPFCLGDPAKSETWWGYLTHGSEKIVDVRGDSHAVVEERMGVVLAAFETAKEEEEENE